MGDVIGIVGKHVSELSSDAASYYAGYWGEGGSVSQETRRRNGAVLDLFFPGGLKGRRVLELGVGGEGGILLPLADRNEVHGIDVSASARRNCRKLGLEIRLGNLDRDGIPFPDARFDLVFAFEVFEHFANPQSVLEEVRRVLEPGGRFVLSTPNPLIHHWPRLFYPELFEEKPFREFLMVNRFQVVQRAGWGENRYAALVPDARGKAWSWLWLCGNMAEARPDVLMEYGRYFLEQRSALGVRTKPVEAADLLRAACAADPHLWEARGLLTLALVYRYVNGEREEFFENLESLMEGLRSPDPARALHSACYLALASIELERFRVKLLTDDRLAELVAHLSSLPGSGPCLQEVQKAMAHHG
ncbi:MAG: class I SAM-dependent methyltransferase [bacterium]